MSNAPTAANKMTAYERWELPSFDEKPVIALPDIQLPTAAEIEAMEQEARDEGYQAGLKLGQEQGYQTGYAEGYATGSEKIINEINDLENITAAIAEAIKTVNEEVAQSLLDLSLSMAQHMVKQVLEVKPEILLEVVKEAISTLPHFNAGAHIVLNPQDAEMLRDKMGEQLSHAGWKIFEDEKMSRGGARIETAHSQVDVTLQNRWSRLSSQLGQDSSWLAQ